MTFELPVKIEVSRELLDKMGDNWSPPVSVRFKDGVLEARAVTLSELSATNEKGEIL